MEIEITLQPKQRQALKKLSNKEAASVIGYGGARGGGKSFLVRAWQILRRLKYPNTNGVIIRKTYPELFNNHIQEIFREYPQLREYYSKSDKILTFPNGSVLYFRHLQHPDDVYNYQGQVFEDIALDEATQHPEEVFRILRASNRTTQLGIRPKMLLTCNPGGVGHLFVKKLFIDKSYSPEERPADYDFVQAFVQDNQILMERDPGYLENLKSLPLEKRKAWLYGDWNVFEGQFFEMWSQKKHVIKPGYELKDAPDSFVYRLAWDEGKLRPRAVLLLVQDYDGKVEVIWEYYRTNETEIRRPMLLRRNCRPSGFTTC